MSYEYAVIYTPGQMAACLTVTSIPLRKVIFILNIKFTKTEHGRFKHVRNSQSFLERRESNS